MTQGPGAWRHGRLLPPTTSLPQRMDCSVPCHPRTGAPGPLPAGWMWVCSLVSQDRAQQWLSPPGADGTVAHPVGACRGSLWPILQLGTPCPLEQGLPQLWVLPVHLQRRQRPVGRGLPSTTSPTLARVQGVWLLGGGVEDLAGWARAREEGGAPVRVCTCPAQH